MFYSIQYEFEFPMLCTYTVSIWFLIYYSIGINKLFNLLTYTTFRQIKSTNWVSKLKMIKWPQKYKNILKKKKNVPCEILTPNIGTKSILLQLLKETDLCRAYVWHVQHRGYVTCTLNYHNINYSCINT